MKEKLLIADCVGNHYKGKISGHYKKTFEQYYKILKNDFDVSLGVTKEYKRKIHFCNNFYNIRFGRDYSKTFNNNKIGRYLSLVKEIINVIMVLNSKYDIVIFQQRNFLFSLIPLIFYFGKKKIFFIVYKDYLNLGRKIKRVIKKFIYALAKKKIKGLIVGIKELGKIYNHNYLAMPDYLFNKEIADNPYMPIKYDIAIVGIITNSKNVLDVVSSFYKTKYKVVIAGKFMDDEQYRKISQFSAKNIKIINDYINSEMYNDILSSTKFVALPYDPKAYPLNSSGVFYDAIYHIKPLITSNTKFFKRVEENNLGYVYKNSIKDSIHILDNLEIYSDYTRNIKDYIKKTNKDIKNKLINFLY